MYLVFTLVGIGSYTIPYTSRHSALSLVAPSSMVDNNSPQSSAAIRDQTLLGKGRAEVASSSCSSLPRDRTKGYYHYLHTMTLSVRNVHVRDETTSSAVTLPPNRFELEVSSWSIRIETCCLLPITPSFKWTLNIRRHTPAGIRTILGLPRLPSLPCHKWHFIPTSIPGFSAVPQILERASIRQISDISTLFVLLGFVGPTLFRSFRST